MTNTELLNAKIKDSGLKIGYIAAKMGISRASLSYKINNHSEFKAIEIVRLTKILNLTSEERSEIFFNEMFAK